MAQIHFAPTNAFTPTYQQQKEQYNNEVDDKDMRSTMEAILYPLQEQHAQLGVTALAQTITSQQLQMQEQQKQLQQQKDADAGYLDASNTLTATGSDGSNVVPMPPPKTAAEAKGRLAAILATQNQHREDASTVTRMAWQNEQANFEAKARVNGGLFDDADWNDPQKRTRAMLDEQIGPVRSQLGKDFGTLDLGDGTTVNDVLADKSNYSARGPLLPPVINRITSAAQQAIRDREDARKLAETTATSTATAKAHADAAVDVQERTSLPLREEHEKDRQNNLIIGINERAHQRAISEEELLAKNPLMVGKMGTPEEVHARIDARTKAIASNWMAQLPNEQAAATSAAPAAEAPARTATNPKTGEKLQFVNGKWQPLN